MNPHANFHHINPGIMSKLIDTRGKPHGKYVIQRCVGDSYTGLIAALLSSTEIVQILQIAVAGLIEELQQLLPARDKASKEL